MEQPSLFSQFPPTHTHFLQKQCPFRREGGWRLCGAESGSSKGSCGPEPWAAVARTFRPVLGQLAEASPTFRAASLPVLRSWGELLPPAASWSRGWSVPPLRSWPGGFLVLGGAKHTAQS